MDRQFAATLREGERVDAVFALRSKEIRAARTGEAYLAVELGDRSGRIAGVMFRPPRDAESVPAGSVVRVQGRVTAYRGVLRVAIESLRPAARYDARELMPAGTRDEREMLAELRARARTIKDLRLRRLLRAVFGDASFLARFARCPASQHYHHAYLGGLLEHTLAVAALCEAAAVQYPEIDRDLLLAGALLHDVGKVDELSFDTAIEYTHEGRLLGHVVLGERRVRMAAETLGGMLPEDLAAKLSHVLLSHHGELEWGSPKRPCTLEALVLHHADNFDAKTAGFIQAAAAAAMVDEPWTDAGNLFRRPLYAPRPAEDERPLPVVEDDQYVRSA